MRTVTQLNAANADLLSEYKMKRFLLSFVITALAGSSVLAANDLPGGDSTEALTARRNRQAARLAREDAPRARLAGQNVRRPVAALVRPRLAARTGNQTPYWGRAARNFRTPGAELGWHVRRPNGVVIARNYPNWARNWWSPRWGIWFRYDPTTSGYYYYEPTVGYYVETATIITYRQPLETPITTPTTDPNDVPVVDPPDPVEP